MNTISLLISTFSSAEKKEILSALKKKNKRNDTKNIQLFKLLDQQKHTTDLDLIIYGKPSKNALYALSKRLQDSLIDFIAEKRIKNESSEEMEVLKLLMASRYFFEHRKYNLAFKTLDKATHKAQQYGFYTLLNEIYYTKIQQAHHHHKNILQTSITQFKENQKHLKQEENLTLFYATVKNEINQNNQNLIQILEANLDIFNISITKNLSYKSLCKILEIITQTANLIRDYNGILKFVNKAYTLLSKEERLIERELFYHIQILYYIANFYFRTKQFLRSQKYLVIIYDKMKCENGKYFHRFFPQYTLLHVLNLNYTGNNAKAISILEQFDYKKYKDQIFYVLDLQLILVVMYFQKEKFKKALKLLINFKHSDSWYLQKTDNIWVIRRKFIELLLYIELEYIDVVESKIKSFRKKYIPYLVSKKEDEVLLFFNLISTLFYKPEKITHPNFLIKVNSLKTAINPKEADIFNISFYAWIKAKIEKETIYKITLEMVG